MSITGNSIHPVRRKARLHSLISGVAFLHCLKRFFCAGNLPRCFTFLTLDSSIYFFSMDKGLVGAVNHKKSKNKNPMLVLECLASLKLSGLLEVIAESIRNIWFVRFEQHPFTRFSSLFCLICCSSWHSGKRLIGINHFG